MSQLALVCTLPPPPPPPKKTTIDGGLSYAWVSSVPKIPSIKEHTCMYFEGDVDFSNTIT